MNSTLSEIHAEISKALLAQPRLPRRWTAALKVVETTDKDTSEKRWWVRQDLDKAGSFLSPSQVKELTSNRLIVGRKVSKKLGNTEVPCLVINAYQLEKILQGALIEEVRLEVKTKVLKQQNQLLRDSVSEEAQFQGLLDEIKKAIGRAKFKQPVSASRQILVPKNKILGGVPTLFLSDWHTGEVVDPEQIEGINEYNLEIAEARCHRVFSQAMKELFTHQAGFRYDAMVIAFGGDMLSGLIHDELLRTNQKGMPDCLIFLAQLIAQEIVKVADNFEEIYVPCVAGNHGRIEGKPSAKNAVTNNLDYLLYLMVEALVKGMLGSANNVTFNISKSLDMQYNIYGTTYLLTHGDQFKESTNSTSFWPNLVAAARKKNERTRTMGGKSFDYMLCGHFHKYGTVDNVIVNGSLKGYDEWVYKNNFSLEAPMQALWVTHPHERFLRHIPIYADEPVDDDSAVGAPISDYRPPVRSR